MPWGIMNKGLKIKVFFGGILFWSACLSGAGAQDEAAIRDIPTVRLNLFQSSKSITAPLDCEILLTNLTNKAYDIQSVMIHLPQGLSAIRPDFSGIIRSQAQLHAIVGKDEIIYSFDIPRVTLSFWESVLDSETLLFVPGQYRLRAEIVLKESGNDKGVRSLYASSQILLEPPLSAALRGGVVGALLLGLFVPAYRSLHDRRKKGDPDYKPLGNPLEVFFIYSVSGAVVSVTTILFIHRMGSANLPISVSVNDYLGGIIIGLFSYVFGDALYKKFFGIRDS